MRIANSCLLLMYEDWESFVKENEAGITGKFSPDPCTLLISMQHIQLCLVVLKITNDKKEKKKMASSES